MVVTTAVPLKKVIFILFYCSSTWEHSNTRGASSNEGTIERGRD